jgi:enabled protein
MEEVPPAPPPPPIVTGYAWAVSDVVTKDANPPPPPTPLGIADRDPPPPPPPPQALIVTEVDPGPTFKIVKVPGDVKV